MEKPILATIKDIAAAAGVSIATVSRVLNDHASVSEATRVSVMQVAKRLNYPIANGKRRPKIERTVLIIVRQDKDGQPPEKRDLDNGIWGSVQQEFEGTDIAARLQQVQMTPEKAATYISDVSVFGLIIVGGLVQPAFAEALNDAKMPFVVAGAGLQKTEVDAVMADVAHGMQQVVEHLVNGGRKNIGFVNGPSDTLTSAEKLDALRYILYSHDLPFPPENLVTSSFSAEDGYRQTQRLLAQVAELDAVVYADDAIALGGVRALREAGLSIPSDVAVTGFGDYEVAKFIDPSLTTVHFDIPQMGRIAAKRLKMLLEEPDEDGWMILMPTQLIVREST